MTDARPGNGFRLLIAGGGTGGHLFPGIAVAEELRRRDPRASVLFVGTGRPVETEILARWNLASRTITAAGLKGMGLWGRLRSLVLAPVGLVQAARIIREFKPQAVLGVGGYVSGPVGLAGRLVGVPTAIHEQNSIPGLANRYLGRWVARVFISFESSRRFFPDQKVRLTGNPVRREIIDAAERVSAEGHLEFTLLVAGGSQGAHAVNQAVMEAAPRLGREIPNLRVIHQTGAQDLEAVRTAWAETGLNAEVAAFIPDMDRVYGEADLVVCRAGALTVAEVAAMGRPALFIPFPQAADNHQEHNARFLADQGAAMVLLQTDLASGVLAETIIGLAGNPEERARMGRAARSAAHLNAAVRIVQGLEELAGWTRPEEREDHGSKA
jgi:UDP-N-acetylglucosamine--N-acetylmuramyl-(pentapeptide) pyrophosphoryl-undecaprenol N-acetylglucosamine transferase